MAEQVRTPGLAIASLVLGIIAVFIGWIPFIGWLIGLLAIIFGFIALSTIKKEGCKGKRMAIAGIIMGFVPFILMIVFLGSMFAYFGALNKQGMLSERCVGTSGLDCVGALQFENSGSSSSIIFSVHNQFGHSLFISDISPDSSGNNDCENPQGAKVNGVILNSDNPAEFENGEKYSFEVMCSNLLKGRVAQDFIISYKNNEGTPSEARISIAGHAG